MADVAQNQADPPANAQNQADPPANAQNQADPPANAQDQADPQAEARDRRAFRTLIWSIVMFFQPLYDSIKTTYDAIGTMCVYFESVWTDWKHWYDREGAYVDRVGFNNFWEITWEEFMTRARNSRTNVIAYIRDGEESLKLCFRIWSQCYKILRESLIDLQDLHNYIAPQGAVPAYEIQVENFTISLRSMCLEMNVNLMHRMFLSSCEFLSHTLNFLAAESDAAPAAVQDAPAADPPAPVQDAPAADPPAPVQDAPAADPPAPVQDAAAK